MGKVTNPHPSAVPQSNAEEVMTFVFVDGCAVVIVSVCVPLSCLVVLYLYSKLEYSWGISPDRYSGVETIRDSSILPTLSTTFCRRGGRDFVVAFSLLLLLLLLLLWDFN